MIEIHAKREYLCPACGRRWDMYLEDGVERSHGLRKIQPAPSLIRCFCGGVAKHIGRISFVPYLSQRDAAELNYFAYDRKSPIGSGCGIPTLNKDPGIPGKEETR